MRPGRSVDSKKLISPLRGRLRSRDRSDAQPLRQIQNSQCGRVDLTPDEVPEALASPRGMNTLGVEISRKPISQCLGDARGEVVGVSVGLTGPPAAGPAGLGIGNANVDVDVGEADGVVDPVGDREEVGVTVGERDGVGVGVGEGGMIFSQRCSGTLAPPISFTNASQRA